MIERYSRPEMVKIWTQQNKYQKWLDVELAACEAWAKLGKIPEESMKVIREKADFDADKIDEIEKVVKHDVIAFLTSVAEYVGPDSRFIHMGMTSSDVLDTSYAMLLKESGEMILDDIKRLMEVLKKRAIEHKMTPQMGRSHGIHAEPVTFGLTLAIWHDEMKRNMHRMERAIETISVGMVSGAVGTFAHMPLDIEEEVCERLGLSPAPASSQIIQRDRHAEFFTTLGIIASSIEKFAVEIRHLQRTEVYEVEEPFTKGQTGSSAMPHKRNPVLSENLTGLARLIRGYALSAIENVPLWHERDISHSSVERVIGPDSTVTLDFMLNRAIGLIDGLVVYPENMMKNLNQMKGLVYSQQIMLKLVDKGITREEAYSFVQRNAMKVWEEGADFKEELFSDSELMKLLSEDEINEAFNLDYYLKNIDNIFKRVFAE